MLIPYRKFYRCQDFAQVQYMHFSSKGKPWLHHKQTSDRIYRLSYGKEARAAFRKWFHTANNVCPWLVDEMAGSSETEVQITRKIKKKKKQ